MSDLDDCSAAKTAEKDGRLREWAKNLSADAQLFTKLLPFGGHVRLRPTVEVEANPNNAPAPAANPFSWSAGVIGGEDPDAIEGFTLDADHLIKFLRASGAMRQESRDRVTAALTELMLQGLVRVYQDDTEAPRYALTEQGLKVQESLA